MRDPCVDLVTLVAQVIDRSEQAKRGPNHDPAKCMSCQTQARAVLDALARAGALTVAPAAQPTPGQVRAEATGGGPCGTCGRAFWTHVCLSCSPDYQTPGPGCGDCRNTGMDQTPCTPMRSLLP